VSPSPADSPLVLASWGGSIVEADQVLVGAVVAAVAVLALVYTAVRLRPRLARRRRRPRASRRP